MSKQGVTFKIRKTVYTQITGITVCCKNARGSYQIGLHTHGGTFGRNVNADELASIAEQCSRQGVDYHDCILVRQQRAAEEACQKEQR